MSAEIRFTDVTKTYAKKNGATRALDGLTFEVAPGEFLGYAGPNGAGKSTSIKAMTGVLSITSGEVRVLDVDPLQKRQHLAQHIGVVFGQRSQMLWELSATEFFDMIKALYRVPTSDWEPRLAHLIDVLELGSFVDQPVRSLSLGQRMRCELASALLPRPKILFLDEPTIGLDIEAKAAMREVLRQLNSEEGTTVVLTTHDLSDIEALCSRLMIIDHGRCAYDGTVEQLLSEYEPEVTVEFHLAQSTQIEFDAAWTVTHQRNVVRVTFDREEHTAGRVIQHVLNQSEVIDLHIVEPNLEDVIRTIYQSSRS